MVESQIRQRGVADARVLDAMRTVPRERFVPVDAGSSGLRRHAAVDRLRSDDFSALHRRLHDRGARASARRIESSRSGPGPAIRPPCWGYWPVRSTRSRSFLSWRRARQRLLRDLGYANVHVREGDGYAGWPEHAPFDRIMVTAAPDEIPQPLIEQLAPGGRLVIPGRLAGRDPVDDDRGEDRDRRRRAADHSRAVRPVYARKAPLTFPSRVRNREA